MRRIAAREQLVGAGRARAVDVGEPDDEVVDAADRAVLAWCSRVSHVEQKLLHVPGAGRAALGAQAAVQADVLVLHHHAAGLQLVGDVEVLRRGSCAGAFSRVRRSASSPLAVKVMQSIGQMSTQASHSMQSCVGEHRLHVAVQAALRLLEARA